MYNKFLLKNGIRVICERVESIQSAVVGVWILAGSRYEDAKHLGVSHFIEHMLFKGTATRTARQIAEEIDFIGGHINAFTAKDCTCFYTKTLDNHIKIAVDILSDILVRSLLKPSDVDLERNVILEEINMYEDSPDELAHDLLAESVWRNCPLGYPILGRPDTVAGIDDLTMRTYLAEKYVPKNIVISVAGSFDETELRDILEETFGNIADSPPGSGIRQATQDSVLYEASSYFRQKDTEQIHLCVGFDGIELGDDDIYALHLANCVFGGGMSSILFQKIREELGLVYSIYSYISAYKRAGMFTIYAGMQAEQAGRVFEMIIGELRAFVASGMTEDLLNRAKEQFKGGFIMGLESPNARMSANGKSELLLGYITAPEETVRKINEVTLDKTYEIMNKVFDMDMLAVSAVGRIDGGLEKILGRTG